MRIPAIVLACVVATCSADAQIVPAIADSASDSTNHAVRVESRHTAALRLLGGASLFYVQPRGSFAQHVGGGVGYALAGSWAADTAGIFAMRAEWQDVTYGYESANDSSARNVIRTLDIGPQLMLPSGAVRPYVSAGVGVAYTGTEGSVPCRRSCSYDEYGDVEPKGFAYLPRMTFSVARAGGVLLRMAKATAARPALWLDLRLSQRHNGETRYATGGTKAVVRGHTDYRVWHVGVSTGLR